RDRRDVIALIRKTAGVKRHTSSKRYTSSKRHTSASLSVSDVFACNSLTSLPISLYLTMAQTMDLDFDVPHFLRDQMQTAPHDLQHYFITFEDLYDRKLWHQLTLKVEEFIAEPASAIFQIPLYQHFVADWEEKMNKLKMVTIGLTAAKQYADPSDAIAFLTALIAKVDTSTTRDAYVHAVMETAHYRLRSGQTEETKDAIDRCEKLLDSFDAVETLIYASFYRVSAEYYKAKADYAQYYKNALLFLACVNIDTDLTAEERVERAHDLSIAALLGDTIYNFGELLMHPILDSLMGTTYDWLKGLLIAFNAGDIGKFESLAPKFPAEPLLQHSLPALSRKICLMSLVEAVFSRDADDRHIPFAAIAAETRLPVDEVEHLVMKALSLKLIKGSIDQVAALVKVEWVQPRVLDRTQIEGMRGRLMSWEQDVGRTAGFVEKEGGEVFAQ
ncbi:hypothetical protein BC938DRAFT_472729, partial [Jimgerdemannia flammicorona]